MSFEGCQNPISVGYMYQQSFNLSLYNVLFSNNVRDIRLATGVTKLLVQGSQFQARPAPSRSVDDAQRRARSKEAARFPSFAIVTRRALVRLCVCVCVSLRLMAGWMQGKPSR